MPHHLTLEAAANEFRVDRRTLRRRLVDAGLAPGKGVTFTIREVYRALTGTDVETAAQIERERLRKLQGECETLELNLARERAELLDAADVAAVWTETVVALRTAVWNFDAPEPVRRRWLLELREIAAKEYLAAKVKPVEATDD